MIRKLNRKLRLLKAIDDEIIQILDKNDVESEVVECEDTNGEIENILALLEERRNPVAANATNQPVIVTQLSIFQSDSENTKRPKLWLPTFNGDTFEAVHDNRSFFFKQVNFGI